MLSGRRHAADPGSAACHLPVRTPNELGVSADEPTVALLSHSTLRRAVHAGIAIVLLAGCSVATADVAMAPVGDATAAAPDQSAPDGDGSGPAGDAPAGDAGPLDAATESQATAGNESSDATTSSSSPVDGADADPAGDGADDATLDADSDAEEQEPPEVVEWPPLDDATRNAFAKAAGPAHKILLDDTIYQVDFERTLRSEGLFDLSSRATVLVDEIRDVSSVDVTLSGTTWDLARSRELSEPPWRLADPPNYTFQLDPFRQAEYLPIDDLLAGWAGLMQADALVGRDDADRFHLEIPHQELLSRMHGGSLSPWTSVMFVNEALDGIVLEGTSPVVLTFADGRLRRVEIDFGPLLADARDAGASLPFDDAVFTESYELTFAA